MWSMRYADRSHRPKEFVKQPTAVESSDEEDESNVGKMPSSDESDA
jgi:probable RNA-binding protein EIF1AD